MRKSSLKVSLVLIGTVALSGCGEERQQRDIYASLADCQKDWGRPGACEAAPTSVSSGSTTAHRYYFGPSYSGATDSRGSPRPSRNAISSMHVARGGFGSSAGFHGASS